MQTKVFSSHWSLLSDRFHLHLLIIQVLLFLSSTGEKKIAESKEEETKRGNECQPEGEKLDEDGILGFGALDFNWATSVGSVILIFEPYKLNQTKKTE